MLLAVDVGNTHTVVGLFRAGELIGHWRLTTARQQTADELRIVAVSLLREARVDPDEVDGAAVACVVPSLRCALRDGLGALLRGSVGFLDAGSSPIPLRVAEPHAVGADRIANGIAAHSRCSGSALVIDGGTALTFDLVGDDGAFLGGAIAPSMQLAAAALVERAAQLFAVDLGVPPSVIGRTTAENIRAGVVLGFIDLVSGLIERFRAEVTGALTVLATGGNGELLVRQIESIESYIPFLTLEGLRLWWEGAGVRGQSSEIQ
jgi:type III pantothenate kinase